MDGSSLLAWRGVMQDADKPTRTASIIVMTVVSCAMVATQTNYIVVGNAHLMAVLAPISAAALLFGPASGALVGFVAGLAENIHALYLPLDAYERLFSAPASSLLLFALMGFVLGVLFALMVRVPAERHLQRLVATCAACFVGSALFTTLLSVSTNLFLALSQFRIPDAMLSDLAGNRELVSQTLLDFAMMAALTVAMGALDYRRRQHEGTETLRETFQGWLAVVMVCAYLVTVALGYTGISVACRASAERTLQGEVNYLIGQLESRDRVIGGIGRDLDVGDDWVESVSQEAIEGIASGIPLGDGGVTAVAEDGTIVSSNVPEYLGRSFEEVVGEGLDGGFDQSLYDQSRSTMWYMGNGEIGFMRAAQLGYVRVARQGSYQVMAALPSSEVFMWRPWLMAAVSAIFILIFASVFLQASLLLKNVVVRGINETNKALSLITQGDLDQEVSVSRPVEFARLSSGINETVGSLKNAISAESARIERDLMTAKAIQESALPNAFPPFPDIDRFDIYASMTPAREIGGDFYDLFLVDDHTLGFLVADVSGKGIPAALFMMAAKTELANYITSGMPLAEAVQTANWHLCQGNDADMFVTVWAAKLDYETGELTYVNAGHNPPLLRHNGTWGWLSQRGGIFLGSFDTAKYQSFRTRLVPGDQLLLYTDGVSEAFSADEEQYGEGRLQAFLEGNSELHPYSLVDALLGELRGWSEGTEQSDDITLLSLEYGVSPVASGTITVPATIDHLHDVLGLIHDELGRRLCPLSTQNQIDISIEELFVNVCSYAYADKDEPGMCRVDYVYKANPNSITVCITDWGVPFDPLSQDDPTAPASIHDAAIGGLGILMTKRLADDISYVRDDDANVIAFSKGW